MTHAKEQTQKNIRKSEIACSKLSKTINVIMRSLSYFMKKLISTKHYSQLLQLLKLKRLFTSVLIVKNRMKAQHYVCVCVCMCKCYPHLHETTLMLSNILVTKSPEKSMRTRSDL